MVEPVTAGLAARAPALAASPLLRPLPLMQRRILRGGGAVLAAAGAALGMSLPPQGRTAAVPGCTALWLGPDEQLLLAPDSPGAPWSALQASLDPLPHALVDVSHRHAAFEVEGSAAAAVLNSGCPLDLDLEVFPAGSCTRTVFGKAGIILWRRAPDRFHVEVWRSFAAYVTQLLALAAGEA